MSMHKKPLTPLEEEGLRKHGLAIGTPSQLSDVFRHGVAWALSQQAAQPVALGKALERECTDPRACTFHRECLGKCHQPLTNANTAMKLRSTDAAAQPQQASDVVLTDADMSDIARDAQIAYFMDKYSSFMMAYARSVEAAVLKKIGGAA